MGNASSSGRPSLPDRPPEGKRGPGYAVEGQPSYSAAMVDPSPRPSPPAGEVIRFPDRRAEIAAAARKPPLTPRGKLYVVLGLLCLVPSILWFLSALTQEVMAGPADRLVDFGFTALSMVGLPVLLGWVLLALGLRQRVYDED